MRLIDADVLRTEIPVDKYGHIDTTITKLNIAMEHSRVDAVQVVRCMDCKYYPDGKQATMWTPCSEDIRLGGKWFCAYGERRAE